MFKGPLKRILIIQTTTILLIVSYGYTMLLNRSGGTEIGAAGLFILGLGSLNILNFISLFKGKKDKFLGKEFYIFLSSLLSSILFMFIGSLVYNHLNVIKQSFRNDVHRALISVFGMGFVLSFHQIKLVCARRVSKQTLYANGYPC